MQTKLQNIFNKSITFFTLIFISFSLVCTSVYKDKNALPTISVAFLISVFVFLLFKIIDKFNEKKLKWLVFSLMSVFVVVEIFVLLNLSSIPNTDSYRCIDTAIGFANGVEKSITNSSLYYNYFCAFSNNNMFVSILELYFSFLKLFNITNFLFFARVLNAISIFLAVVFTFLSTNKLFGLKKAAKTLVLLCLCPIFYVFIEWVYTLTFSLPIMMALVYVLISLTKAKTTKHRIFLSLICAFLTVVGYLIRPTAIFPLIAFALVAILNFKTKYFKKYLVCFVSFLLVFVATFTPLSNFANNKFQNTLDKNHPITHWIMMGLGDNGGLSYEDYALTKSFGDTKKEKMQGNLKEISRRINEKGVLGLTQHFFKKTAKTFTDGTFGIKHRIDHQQKSNSLKPFINGKNDWFFTLYCQSFRIFIYLFATICLTLVLISKKKHHILMPVIITVLGGYVFYLIWEAKQTYSLAFLIFTIILAVYGLDFSSKKISLEQSIFKKITVKNIIVFVLIVSLITSLIASFKLYDNYCKNEHINNIVIDNIIRKYGHKQNALHLNQEFICDDDFNYIKLYAYNNADFKKRIKSKETFDLILKNENKNTIFSSAIKYSDFKIADKLRVCLIKLNKVENNKETKYNIIINSDKSIDWLVSNSNGIDIYKGDLTIDNKKFCNDLAIKVGNECITPKMPNAIYFLIWIEICLIQISLILSLLIKRFKNKLYFI